MTGCRCYPMLMPDHSQRTSADPSHRMTRAMTAHRIQAPIRLLPWYDLTVPLALDRTVALDSGP